MNNNIKTAIALLVGIAIGVTATFVPGSYEQWQANQAWQEKLTTDPVYKFIDRLESEYPDIVVLGKEEGADGSWLMIWIMWDSYAKYAQLPDQEARLVYLYEGLIPAILRNLADVYPNHSGYTVMFSYPQTVETVNGPQTIVGGSAFLSMSDLTLNSFLANPNKATFDELTDAGEIMFYATAYYGGTPYLKQENMIERDPGYVWPWEEGCAVCN